MSRLYAPTVFDALNGIFCVYKPAGKHVSEFIHALKTNLSRELNQMPCRPPRQRVLINNQQAENNDSSLPTIATVPDLADHPLVVGPRYIYDDFHIAAVDRLGKHSSGVLVMGIGRAVSLLRRLNDSRYLRVYHIKGQLGLATHNFSPSGRVIEKTTFQHVGHGRLDRVISAMQAGHQRHMFIAAGVDIQSQEAYELASQGLIRPVAKGDASAAGPVLYGIRCVHFKPPEFTLEVHAINESSNYLMKMIHEIGLEVRSSAVCTAVRRIRYGHFGLTHALLTKHCDARSIAENIDFCRPLVNKFLRTRQSDVISSQRVETIDDDQMSRRDSFDNDFDIDSPVKLSPGNHVVEDSTSVTICRSKAT